MAPAREVAACQTRWSVARTCVVADGQPSWWLCTGTAMEQSRCLGLTICGSWMSARLEIRAWLRPASSFSRLSLFCSMSLFSSSIVFRLLSIDVIWNGNNLGMWAAGFWRKGIRWPWLPRREYSATSPHKTATHHIALSWNHIPKFTSLAQTSPMSCKFHISTWLHGGYLKLSVFKSEALLLSPKPAPHIVLTFPIEHRSGLRGISEGSLSLIL